MVRPILKYCHFVCFRYKNLKRLKTVSVMKMKMKMKTQAISAIMNATHLKKYLIIQKNVKKYMDS